MEKSTIATELKNVADKHGVLAVLSEFLPNIRVRLPMSRVLMQTSLEELALSVRSRNGLMRAGARTIGDVAAVIMSEAGLNGIHNLGKKSNCEIKTAILTMAYANLREQDKTAFWLYVIENNGIQNRATC